MSSAKSLTDEQVATIRSWAEAGDQLPDIQRKLGEELGVKITYLETRFLIEDLGIELVVEEPPKEEEPAAEEPAGDQDGSDDEGVASESGVTVTVDSVQRPGAMVSGTANFGGTQKIAWWLDQYGRLGMDADDPEFRPTEEQATAFQKELQGALRKAGF